MTHLGWIHNLVRIWQGASKKKKITEEWVSVASSFCILFSISLISLCMPESFLQQSSSLGSSLSVASALSYSCSEVVKIKNYVPIFITFSFLQRYIRVAVVLNLHAFARQWPDLRYWSQQALVGKHPKIKSCMVGGIVWQIWFLLPF